MEASILCQIYRTSAPYFGARSFTCSGGENECRIVVVLHHKTTDIFASTRYVVMCEVKAWYCNKYQPVGFLCSSIPKSCVNKIFKYHKIAKEFSNNYATAFILKITSNFFSGTFYRHYCVCRRSKLHEL
jgi:hypothetical protein